MPSSKHYLMLISLVITAPAHCIADVFKDSKLSLSSRTLYFDNNIKPLDADQRQIATGLKIDYQSGFTDSVLGFGFDLQGVWGVNLDGGIDNHSASTNNSLSPVDSDGTPVSEWSSIRGAAKLKYSKTEAKIGNSLQPNLPVLVANDGRLLPVAYNSPAAIWTT